MQGHTHTEVAGACGGRFGCKWLLRAAHPLVTWSTLAPDVFPAWSLAWFTISRKEDREHRANSGKPAWFTISRKEDREHRASPGYSRATASPSRIWRQSAFTCDLGFAHRPPRSPIDIKLFSKKNQVHLFFLASLFWHRREALSFFFFSLPFGRGAMLSAGKRWLVQCFAAPSTHTCPV